MKVLWICNCPNRSASEYLGEKPSVYGGWLTGMSEVLAKSEDIELVYCFPRIAEKEQINFFKGNIHYYSFCVPLKYGFFKIDADKDNIKERSDIKRILSTEHPDLIHIFGTEYIHALMVAEECRDKSKLICSIQGLTSVISKHYLSLIPPVLWHKVNIATIFRKTLWGQRQELQKRGKREIRTLQLCPNIIGRTEWDEVCSLFINPTRKYFKCNETLRSAFYDYAWNYENCTKHSIFVSQGSSPLKGFNILIEAVYLLKKEFPDVVVRVAGNNFIDKTSLLNRVKISTYGEYIRKLLTDFSLQENIIFLGSLDEKAMVEEYLKCNVFVSASAIENSSNSVCEAMLLGVPVVSSNVGGISSLLQDNIEGLLYQADAPYMAAAKIRKFFVGSELAKNVGKNARSRALVSHDRDENNRQLKKIYNTIYEENKNARD